MRDEPNAEEGVYPFEGCCEHADRLHSSKACQIPGCKCKRRRQLPRPVVPPTVEPGELEALLADPGWRVSHEILRGEETTMVVTRIIRPDGTVLDEAGWTP